MRIIRTTVAVLATAAAFSSFASPAAAFTERFDNLLSHFFECKVLLLTDLEAHARECGGGTMPTSFESLSGRVDGAPPQTTPVVTTPDEEEEECEEESEGSYEYWCKCHEQPT